jgi:hypothetical protein
VYKAPDTAELARCRYARSSTAAAEENRERWRPRRLLSLIALASAAPQARLGCYFSTKYAPLPWPLENQRLVTVFLRV